MRNMQSVGLDLQPFLDQDLLCIDAPCLTLNSLERYLVTLHRLVSESQPHTSSTSSATWCRWAASARFAACSSA
ncbi:hypothetical protein [Hymenobacter nivis]|uniref:Uncharacterized protein n=1 Tax=Hymenobacter nivis TaxID=1850093 RepID=A0A2Z3GWL9_9BACT|nr:hypothetical protein [Hymenobacter nivis]AWM33080.1 hypothetical protein DDQ68_10015 [Hymenobacter nivis]